MCADAKLINWQFMTYLIHRAIVVECCQNVDQTPAFAFAPPAPAPPSSTQHISPDESTARFALPPRPSQLQI